LGLALACLCVRAERLITPSRIFGKAAARRSFYFEQCFARMSALGPKRTSTTALHMSAFGGKADMTFCGANVRF